MSADTDPVAEPHAPTMPPPAQAPAEPAPEAPTGAKAVSSLAAHIAPLRLATRPPNLSPIADASPATTIPPMRNPSVSAPQPIPAPRAVPAAQSSPAQPSPGSSAPLGSPVNTTHLRSRSPHSPSSPAFTASSSGSSRARGRPTSQLVGSISAAIGSKPRSNSSLTSNRPAPPSPAGSRPPSQLLEFSPGNLPATGFGLPISPPAIARSSPSPVGGRERAASTSSAVSQGRRMRPRSTLGTSVMSASEGTSMSDPTTPYSQPATVLGRRGGSFDARSGGFDLSAAVEEAKDELGSSGSSEGQTPPPSAPASAAAPASPAKGTLAHLTAGLVRRVIVRDFAFSQDDERFLGLGAQRPRSNWCEGEPEPEPAPVKTHGGFGFLGSWGFLRRDTDAEEPDAGGVEDLGNEQDADDYWSEADEFEDDYLLAEEEPDGLYRAAYQFEPEGMNEMAVDVGDLLDVRGRGGGGDGWVVATRLDTGAEGLVPEGYLERTREDEYPAEWATVRDVRAKLAAACAESLETRELSESPESTDEEERVRRVLELNAGH